MEQKITSIPEIAYDRYRLANGLEVILHEDHRLPLVAVNIWYHVGPADERPGLRGFAHLFEHMMFEGSKYVGEKAHFLHLESAGASTINGTTDFDRTSFYETLPSNRLELALWLESDRMGFLLDGLDSRKLETQRDVVRNERRQVVENTPYGLVQEEVFHQLFPESHPYYASIMGSHADIEAARLVDVRNFFQRYYIPNNASLVIAGDIDPAGVRELVERYFGPIPSGETVSRVPVDTPPIREERRAVVEDQVELPRVYLAWITDPIFTQADAECDLVARILGGGRSSRLYRKLVYEQRLAQGVSAAQASMALGSIFAIEATAKPGVDPERLEAALRHELELFRKEGPAKEELERARNIMESGVIRSLESLGGLADRLNLYNHYAGNPGFLAEDLGRYRKCTLESLRAVAHDRLERHRGVTVWGVNGTRVICDVPKSPAVEEPIPEPGPVVPDQEWRSTPPAAGPAPSFNLPVPRIFRLSNGLTVMLAERHNLPIVSANVIVLGGSDRNSEEHPGLASFTAGMLDEGTLSRQPLQIAADADQIGASLSTGSGTDLSFAAIRTLARNTEAAFELVSDVLLHPAFAPKEIERVRHDRITQIMQQRDNPAVLALKVFLDSVYGPQHPYGHNDLGTEDSNRAVTREMLLEFYREGYFAANAALVVTGDIDEAWLLDLADKYFGAWPGSGRACRPPEVASHPARRLVIVERPGAPQTVLRIGHVGVARSHPDHTALDVANTAFGGLFTSRINRNLREKHGYTYGASSVFAFRRGPGPFLIGASVHTEATVPAIKEIFREIERLREGTLTARELATAKDSITRSLPSMFETTPEAASSIGQLFVHGLQPDYYQLLPEKIDGVTAAEAQRAVRNHIRPEEAVIVAVGDREQIEPELEKLGCGQVEIRDPHGHTKQQ